MDNQDETKLFTGAASAQSGAQSDVQSADSDKSGATSSDLEREALFGRVRLLGVKHSNNIGTDKLRELIAAKQAELEAGDAAKEAAATNPLMDAAMTATPDATSETSTPAVEAPLTEAQKKARLRKQLMDEQLRLVRVRITCMDPKKKALHGEIITVANEYIGTVKRFVPYGEVTDNGWHIPFCIYTFLNERKFLNIRTLKDKRTNTNKVSAVWAKEFAIEILEPLTEKELARLAAQQAAAGAIDSESIEA